MNILVINAGSSSLKYQLLNPETGVLLAKGLCERIGIDGKFTYKPQIEGKQVLDAVDVAMPTHSEAIQAVLNALVDKDNGVIGSMKEIDAVGHRVVHGGEAFNKSVLITDEVMKALEDCIPLAPLHNPANITGINACRAVMGDDVPMVAVFDTAFHQTMPGKAYMYAIPYEYYQNDGIRRYGFHGTSHRYEWMMAKEILGSRCHRLLSCHLGNGASLAAIEDGVCRDTTMGLTPLDGLMMGTRCGSIDPATVCYLQREGGYSYQEVDDMMNKQSGLLAISGISNDARDIRTRASEGDERCLLAFDMFAYKAMQQAGSMIASMAGVDTITFTAGIGENDWSIRKAFCDCFEWLGVRIDNNKNREAVGNGPQVISAAGSSVTVMVIPTDEEYMIAHDVERLTKNN